MRRLFVLADVYCLTSRCTEARRLLTGALLDVAETRLELGQSLPTPNPNVTDPEMDFEEPIYLHLSASSDVEQTPARELAL